MYRKHSLNRNCNIQTKSDHHKTYMHGWKLNNRKLEVKEMLPEWIAGSAALSGLKGLVLRFLWLSQAYLGTVSGKGKWNLQLCSLGVVCGSSVSINDFHISYLFCTHSSLDNWNLDISLCSSKNLHIKFPVWSLFHIGTSNSVWQ